MLIKLNRPTVSEAEAALTTYVLLHMVKVLRMKPYENLKALENVMPGMAEQMSALVPGFVSDEQENGKQTAEMVLGALGNLSDEFSKTFEGVDPESMFSNLLYLLDIGCSMGTSLEDAWFKGFADGLSGLEPDDSLFDDLLK